MRVPRGAHPITTEPAASRTTSRLNLPGRRAVVPLYPIERTPLLSSLTTPRGEGLPAEPSRTKRFRQRLKLPAEPPHPGLLPPGEKEPALRTADNALPGGFIRSVASAACNRSNEYPV